MPLPLIRYPLDITGINPDNLVVGEIHALANKPIRAVAPTYGAYFTESLRVWDNQNNTLLVRGTQYLCTELLQTASEEYGKEICYLILIIDPLVSPNVRINYQLLGGLYTRSGDAIVNLYQNIQLDNRPVNWIEVLNKPLEFPPNTHLHDIQDVYGFEYLVNALERVRNAIVISDVPAFESTMDWLTGEINAIRGFYAAQLDVVSAHIADKGNPHENTKEQVGLGYVENHPVANFEDIDYLLGLPPGADDRTIATDKYVTLRQLLRFKNSLVTRIKALEDRP